MMNFPDTPTSGQSFGTYTWDGEKWVSTGSLGGVPEAPADHKIYGRKDLTWQEVISDVTKAYVDTEVAKLVAKAGDVMTGALTLTALTSTAGINLGANAVAAATDVTRHLALYGTSYGLNVTSGTVNIVSQGAAVLSLTNNMATVAGTVYTSGRGFSPSNVDLAGLMSWGSFGGGLTLVDGGNRASMWAQSADLALATGAGAAPAIKLLLANSNSHTLYGTLTTSGGDLHTNTITAAGITCTAINTQANRIDCGTISCYGINQNGYGLTTWGITNYGQSNLSAVGCGTITCSTINTQGNRIDCGDIGCSSSTISTAGINVYGSATINQSWRDYGLIYWGNQGNKYLEQNGSEVQWVNVNLHIPQGSIDCAGTLTSSRMQINSDGNWIVMNDVTWGSMVIHHQDDIMGFLNNGNGWIFYVRNDGYVWCGALGWIHDYINGQIAGSFNQCVTSLRWVWAGGPGINDDGNYHEDVPHAAHTGYAAGRGGYIGNFMHRYLQCYTANSGWQTVYYAD